MLNTSNVLLDINPASSIIVYRILFTTETTLFEIDMASPLERVHDLSRGKESIRMQFSAHFLTALLRSSLYAANIGN